MTSIAGDLFQDRIEQSASGWRWKIIILIVLASLTTFAGTWFVLRANKPTITSNPGSVVSTVAVPAPPPNNAPIAVTAPVQTVTVPAANVTAPAVRPSPPVAPETVDEELPSRSVKRSFNAPPAAAAPAPLKPSLQSVQPPAEIKLSGIAWQDERSARRAVVNGFLLKEGSVVSGARVTEIMADRVRFALPSGTFEVRLDAVPAAEVRR